MSGTRRGTCGLKEEPPRSDSRRSAMKRSDMFSLVLWETDAAAGVVAGVVAGASKLRRPGLPAGHFTTGPLPCSRSSNVPLDLTPAATSDRAENGLDTNALAGGRPRPAVRAYCGGARAL